MDDMEKATNEKRLIDANAFLKDILTAGIGKTIIEYSESDVGYMIRKRPTVDAVEVVRCRECYHKTHDESGRPYCLQLKMYLNKELDFFCKYGKRKGGAD